MKKSHNGSIIAGISALALLAIIVTVLVIVYFASGPVGVGGGNTIKFVFEKGYSNELSSSAFLQSKYSTNRNLENIIASYGITDDVNLEPKIENKLSEVFKKNKVTLTIGEKSITYDPGGNWNNYITISKKIPLLGGEMKKVNLWIFIK